MQLEISRKADCTDLDLTRLSAALEMAFADRLDGTVSLALVDDHNIHQLNREYLNHDFPTDVISFPLEDDDQLDPENVIGEVVVSIEKARAEAIARSIPLIEETLRYCVHGCLHLLGYDDQSEDAAEKMKNEQERIVALVFS